MRLVMFHQLHFNIKINMVNKSLLCFIVIFLHENQVWCNNDQTIIRMPQKMNCLLNLENSKCENIEDNVSLNFQNSGLKHIYSDFINNSDVICLNLKDNQITHISSTAFRLMPNLLCLNLAGNKLPLSNISDLDSHSYLSILNLDGIDSECSENSTFQLYNKFPNLKFLYLRNNSIKNISSFTFAPKLTHLFLSSNNLDDLELSFLNETLASLILLDLANNTIQNFNASKLISLQVLQLSHNQINRICKSHCQNSALILEGVINLTHLLLASNELTDIEPDAFDNAKDLIDLDLSHNQIRSIQKNTFEWLEKLRNLSFEDNLLTKMPDLYGARSLEYLTLSKNYLEIVNSESFSYNVRLRNIDLSNNNIRTIEAGAFIRQVFLEYLNLSNNRLTIFPNMWLNSLYRLEILDVKNNEIKSLDDLRLNDMTYKYFKLKFVYLQNNYIFKFNSASVYDISRKCSNLTLQLHNEDEQINSLDVFSNTTLCKCDNNHNKIA